MRFELCILCQLHIILKISRSKIFLAVELFEKTSLPCIHIIIIRTDCPG